MEDHDALLGLRMIISRVPLGASATAEVGRALKDCGDGHRPGNDLHRALQVGDSLLDTPKAPFTSLVCVALNAFFTFLASGAKTGRAQRASP